MLKEIQMEEAQHVSTRKWGSALVALAAALLVFIGSDLLGLFGDLGVPVAAIVAPPFLIIGVPLITSPGRFYSRSKLVRRLKLVAFVSLALVLHYLTISFLSGWCCLRASVMQDLCDLTRETALMMDRNGIDYSLCWATLMAPIRDQHRPFQSIPWEHDNDLCIHSRDAERFIQASRSDEAFLRVASFTTAVGGRADDFGRVFPRSQSLRGVLARAYVDMWTWEERAASGVTTDQVLEPTLRVPNGPNRWVTVNRSDVFPTTNQSVPTYCGWDGYRYPAKIMNVIHAFFGKGFRTPRFPPNYKGLLCRLSMDGCSRF